ncbi:coiled-coil domain-containing protein 138 [Melospiza georgiana]|uniref:coiled-coil domain-containing protein 138 n=1 Tax=Melospiza georgiana TaxID=44398 RepID=UPI0025AC3726|nr:coiled-coil domain-containing protein 138 [Melospiza georgiana]
MAGPGPGRSAPALQRRCPQGPAGVRRGRGGGPRGGGGGTEKPFLPRRVPGVFGEMEGGGPVRCLGVHCERRAAATRAVRDQSVSDSSLKNITISLSNCSLESEFTEAGREKSIRPSDFQKSSKNCDCFDDEQDYFCGSSGLDIEEDSIICSETDAVQNAAIYTGAGLTLPSNLAANNQENMDQISNHGLLKKIVHGTGAQACNRQGLIPPHISQIYDELLVIHQKLQRESSAQQEYALQLQKRERCLTEQETLFFQHEAALAKIRGVEEEVHTKIAAIKEQHEAEVKQLTEALREITKENRRLKSSYDSLRDVNDSLRKQLSDVTELNKKLEGQARKAKARLENLQRKHEFSKVWKSNDLCQVMKEGKPMKQEKVMAKSRTATLPLNSQVYELLTYLMDWISDQHLSKIKTQEESHKPRVTQSSKNFYTQEKCMKLLPTAAEQLQWMPYVNPKLHVSVIKFIYWSIRQLDTDTQHTAMRSTMRRLGEDIFKGIVSKGNPQSSSEQPTESKSKSAAFFKSLCMPLRFLSTLIVLKTVKQVDYLAQAFESLRADLKTDEGKALFLEYQCVPVVLSHLKVSSTSLLSRALDGLLQMTMESGSLQPFLEACSNESFFQTCSVLLRSSKLDIAVLEKLCVILQKLSRIKSNKKLFEMFGLHRMFQELRRTVDPGHTFLCINLNSILLNLEFLTSNSLDSSLSTSH